MKIKHYILMTVITGLVCLTGYAAMVMDADDFEHDAVGAEPNKATAVNSAAPTANASVEVVDQAANSAGIGKGVSLLDDDAGTGIQLEYDFSIILDNAPTADLDRAARLSAVRVDLSFDSPSITTPKTHYLNVTLGEHLVSQSDYSGHFLDCRLYDDGTIDFISSDGSESIGHVVSNPNNTLSIFANDYATGITYPGPNGSSYNLPGDSVAYWLNGTLITFGGQEYASMEDRITSNGTVFNSTNNLGRFAIVSTTGSDGLDYVFDNIMITDLDSMQDPTGTSWLVSDSLTGLVYTGYSNQGQTDRSTRCPTSLLQATEAAACPSPLFLQYPKQRSFLALPEGMIPHKYRPP